jgi:hypothetical protein
VAEINVPVLCSGEQDNGSYDVLPAEEKERFSIFDEVILMTTR